MISYGGIRTDIEIETLQQAARILKAVSHPLRLRILEVLGNGELPVKEIQFAVGEPQAIISQHLGLMRDRGVLRARRYGTSVYYSIASDFVSEVLNCIRGCSRDSGLKGTEG